MNIAVLSGKGGAGKTFVGVNLASVINNASYIDCDVEEPNGRLFFKPEITEEITVSTPIPEFDESLCNGCKKCVEFCNFNALIYIKDKPLLFTEVCHACGLCELVCPQKAIKEGSRPIGKVEIGKHNNVNVITGILNTSEASGIKVIQKAQEIGISLAQTSIIDCPPGCACSVIESIANADYCVLVAEPTAFGFHNFKMVHELAKLLNKRCGVVINKEYDKYTPLYDYCKNEKLEILASLCYNEKIASLIAGGKIASEYDEKTRAIFENIIDKISANIGGGAL